MGDLQERFAERFNSSSLMGEELRGGKKEHLQLESVHGW